MRTKALQVPVMPAIFGAHGAPYRIGPAAQVGAEAVGCAMRTKALLMPVMPAILGAHGAPYGIVAVFQWSA